MANMYGYKPILVIAESTDWASAIKTPDKLTVRPVKSGIESTSKTGQLTEMVQETIGGRQYYEYTIEGELTIENAEYLLAYFGSGSSPIVPTSNNVFYDFSFARHYSATSADVINGAIFRTFKITGETNGIWKYEITGWAKEYLENEDVSVDLDYPNYPTIAASDYECTPYLFGNTTITQLTSIDYEKAFNIELNMEYELDDEKFIFANANEITSLSRNKFTGTLSFGSEFVVGKDATVATLYSNDTAQGYFDFTLTDGLTIPVDTIQFEGYGVITEYNRPDPDRQLYEANFTTRLQGWYDAGTYTAPITITVTKP